MTRRSERPFAALVAAVALALTGSVTALASVVPPTSPGPRPIGANETCQPGGPDLGYLPPAQRRLDADAVWSVTTGGGVRIGLIGSGVDPDNPQLAGHVEAGADQVAVGYSGNGDCVGHGTALAGLVVAQPTDGIGLVGVAPDAVVLPERVTGDGLQTTADWIALGIDDAVAQGVQVILVTLSVPGSTLSLDAAVARAEAADVLVVAPADPLPDGLPGFSFPAAYESVVAVASLDANGETTSAPDGAPQVIDLVAPGEGVVATLPGSGQTTAVTGTAPAAAYVAGVAALVRSAYPARSAAQVRQRLFVTADRPGTEVPDRDAGWGVVNPLLAVTAEVAAEPLAPPLDPRTSIAGPAEPAPPDRTAESRALWLTLIGGLAGLVILVGVRVVPAARRRGWRPGRSAQSPDVT